MLSDTNIGYSNDENNIQIRYSAYVFNESKPVISSSNERYRYTINHISEGKFSIIFPCSNKYVLVKISKRFGIAYENEMLCKEMFSVAYKCAIFLLC